MRRVDDNHIGARDGIHHAVAGTFHAHLTDTRFDQRVAFHLFVFVFDFLFGHAQFLQMLIFLIGVVGNGDDQNGDNYRKNQQYHNFMNKR